MADTPRNIKVTLTLPEELVDAYEKKGEAYNLTAHTAMSRVLKQAKAINFEERPLVLSTAARRDLEAICETTIENEQQLMAVVKNLLRIDMGEVTIYLTERQADKFAEFATYFDQDVNDYMVEKLTDAVNYVLGEW